MITDEMIKKAAAAAEEQSLTGLPENHEFSEAFQRRIDRAKRRAQRSGAQKAVRYATLMLVLFLTVLGGVLALSPEVRADVADWYKASFFVSSGSGKVPEAERKDYCLTWLPEGHSLYDIMETGMGKTYLDVDSQGRGLAFDYIYSGKSFSMVQGYEHKQVMLGDVQADVFLSPWEEHSSCIIWKDPAGNVRFSISAFGDEELLIRLALSVSEK